MCKSVGVATLQVVAEVWETFCLSLPALRNQTINNIEKMRLKPVLLQYFFKSTITFNCLKPFIKGFYVLFVLTIFEP